MKWLKGGLEPLEKHVLLRNLDVSELQTVLKYNEMYLHSEVGISG